MAIIRAKSQAGSGDFVVEERTITAAEAAAKKLTLAFTPDEPTEVRMFSPCGPIQRYDFDYDVINGNEVNWDFKALETLIEEGDVFIFHYFTN